MYMVETFWNGVRIDPEYNYDIILGLMTKLHKEREN